MADILEHTGLNYATNTCCQNIENEIQSLKQYLETIHFTIAIYVILKRLLPIIPS